MRPLASSRRRPSRAVAAFSRFVRTLRRFATAPRYAQANSSRVTRRAFTVMGSLKAVRSFSNSASHDSPRYQIYRTSEGPTLRCVSCARIHAALRRPSNCRSMSRRKAAAKSGPKFQLWPSEFTSADEESAGQCALEDIHAQQRNIRECSGCALAEGDDVFVRAKLGSRVARVRDDGYRLMAVAPARRTRRAPPAVGALGCP